MQGFQTFRKIQHQPHGAPFAKLLPAAGVVPHLLLEAPGVGEVGLPVAEQVGQVVQLMDGGAGLLGAHGNHPLFRKYHEDQRVVRLGAVLHKINGGLGVLRQKGRIVEADEGGVAGGNVPVQVRPDVIVVRFQKQFLGIHRGVDLLPVDHR